MQTFLITGTDRNGYGACSPCHKGVLLGFGNASEPVPRTVSWHLGLSRIGDTRYYATVNQTKSATLELYTVAEQVDFKTSQSSFNVKRLANLVALPAAQAQSCVFAADGAFTELQPVAGWHATPAIGEWNPKDGADARFLMFAAPDGAVTAATTLLSDTAILHSLCGCVAFGQSGFPAVYDRCTNNKSWAATETGCTTVPLDGGASYSDNFLVRVHEVELCQAIGHVTKIVCSLFLFSKTEMESLLSCPSSFRGGYFATDTTEGVAGKTIAYRAHPRSVATARLMQRASGVTISAAGQPDTGPLLLAAAGGDTRSSPFVFVPHVIPHARAHSLHAGATKSHVVTGVGMPFLVQPTGEFQGPTAGQPHATHTRETLMAATKALNVIVRVANGLQRSSTKSLPAYVREAAKSARKSHGGLAVATGHLVTALPGVVEWAIGRTLTSDEFPVDVLRELKENMEPLALPLESHARELGFALRAIYRAVVSPPVALIHPDSTRETTRVAVMKLLLDCPVRTAVVLATPLDKHRGTQNKSILLVDQGTIALADWNLYFVDPLACDALDSPPHVDRTNANLTCQLTKAGHNEPVCAVWALDFCQTSVKLSDPWNCRNVSDTSSYAYFSAKLASGVVAVLRVACNNRNHAGLPPGRVMRVDSKDQPNPGWRGIEFLYATSNQ